MSSDVEMESNRTRKKRNGKAKPENIVELEKSPPRKRRPKTKESSSSSESAGTTTAPKMSQSKETFEPIPSTSRAPDFYNTRMYKQACEPIFAPRYVPNSGTEEKSADNAISPKVMKYFLNSYKDSPDYQDLKNKRFNTSFLHEIPRGDREINIFTLEEENSGIWYENLPVIKNKIRGVPGEKYAETFKSIPGLASVDLDDEVKAKKKAKKGKNAGKGGKKGRKASIGYKGVPLPDENLLVDYTGFFDSDSPSHYSLDTSDEESCAASHEKSMNKDSSILLSLLSSPSKKAVKPYEAKYHTPVSSKNVGPMRKYQKAGISSCDLVRKEDQVYLDRYKHLIGGRSLRVVLKRLPQDVLQSTIKKKKPKSAVASKGKKRVAKKKLLPSEKATDNRVLRACVSKLLAKTRDSTTNSCGI